MRNAIVVSFLLLSACAKRADDPREGSYIQEEFVPYVQFYENYYNKTVFDVPITFKDLDGNWIGLCKRWSNGWAEIFIDPDNWEISTELERKSLIIHELGHCHMYQDHRNFSLSDGCRGSIMDEYAINPNCLERHWDYYLEEMR